MLYTRRRRENVHRKQDEQKKQEMSVDANKEKTEKDVSDEGMKKNASPVSRI